MPLFKGEGYKCTPDKAIEYITRPGKALLVSSLYLDDTRNYAKQFRETAYSFGKGKGYGERKYYHFKLSADPKDNLTPEQSQRLAEELAQELFPDHECVIATHIDTGIVHSHIIVNSVNFDTGLKLHVNNREYAGMKDHANKVAARHGYRELDWRNPADDKINREEYQIRKDGRESWRDNLKGLLDKAMAECDSFISLRNYMETQGVKVDVRGKTISFTYPGMKKAVRGDKLGEKYTKAAIENVLLKNRQNTNTKQPEEIKPIEEVKPIEKAAPVKVAAPVPVRSAADLAQAPGSSSGKLSLKDMVAAAHQKTREKQSANKEQYREPAFKTEYTTTTKAYCPNYTESKSMRLTFLQVVKAILLGQRRSAKRYQYDYRLNMQARYNIKVMSGTLEFLSMHGVSNYTEFESRMNIFAGTVGKLELELQSVNNSIPKYQQIHGALLNFQAHEHIAEQYKSKVLFRDNFYRQHESELKAYAKAQEILNHYGIEPHSSAPEIKAKLDELRRRQASIPRELRAAKDELYQWQRVERNLRKILEDRQPKYRLDRERNKEKAPRRNKGVER